MRRSSIKYRHAGRYTIMGQPQPDYLIGDTHVTNLLHTDHHMILRPYHSHSTLQKQVKRRTYSTVGVWKAAINKLQGVEGGYPRGSQGSALKALRENIDRIYRIAMKISSDWSNQIDLGHSQCPLFSLVNHTDYRDRYIGEDRTTRVRYVGSVSSHLHS